MDGPLVAHVPAILHFIRQENNARIWRRVKQCGVVAKVCDIIDMFDFDAQNPQFEYQSCWNNILYGVM